MLVSGRAQRTWAGPLLQWPWGWSWVISDSSIQSPSSYLLGPTQCLALYLTHWFPVGKVWGRVDTGRVGNSPGEKS